MDSKTINIYQHHAQNYINSFASQSPDFLYDLVRVYFYKESKTLDLGSGAGRDVAWLNKNGYPCDGLETVDDFIECSRSNYPKFTWISDSLPELKQIKDESYGNIFLCAVLMHLPSHEIIESLINILRVLRKTGRLIISYRHGVDLDEEGRESDGRLYTPVPISKMTYMLESLGAKVIFVNESEDPDRKGIVWITIVAEKTEMDKKEGLERIQEVIVKDKKDHCCPVKYRQSPRDQVLRVCQAF